MVPPLLLSPFCYYCPTVTIFLLLSPTITTFTVTIPHGYYCPSVTIATLLLSSIVTISPLLLSPTVIILQCYNIHLLLSPPCSHAHCPPHPSAAVLLLCVTVLIPTIPTSLFLFLILYSYPSLPQPKFPPLLQCLLPFLLLPVTALSPPAPVSSPVSETPLGPVLLLLNHVQAVADTARPRASFGHLTWWLLLCLGDSAANTSLSPPPVSARAKVEIAPAWPCAPGPAEIPFLRVRLRCLRTVPF